MGANSIIATSSSRRVGAFGGGIRTSIVFSEEEGFGEEEDSGEKEVSQPIANKEEFRLIEVEVGSVGSIVQQDLWPGCRSLAPLRRRRRNGK
ncbi:hypothetical protein U1Q18_038591 [Sarracenia purpurea var. burkii]